MVVKVVNRDTRILFSTTQILWKSLQTKEQTGTDYLVNRGIREGSIS